MFSPVSFNSLLIVTLSTSTGIFLSILSNVIETLVLVDLFPLFPPSYNNEFNLLTRNKLGLLSPKQKVIASNMLDLPEPFGPVIAISPLSVGV